MEPNPPPSLDPQSTKSPLQSKTILGGIGTAVPVIILLLSFFGVDISDLGGDLAKGLGGLVGLIGTIMVIVGRVKATKQISRGGTLPAVAGLLIPIFLLNGCALTAEQRSTATSSTVSFLVQKAMNIALGTVVAAAQSSTDSAAKGDWLDSLAKGFRSSVSISSDDIWRLVQIWTPADKSHWSNLGQELVQFYDQTKAVPEPQRIEAIAYGLNLAAERARTAVANPPRA